MELRHMGGRFLTIVKKYRYVLLILLVGISLMLIPDGEEEKNEIQTVIPYQSPDLSKELKETLEQIKGAGHLQVLLTTAAGEETIYQCDTHTTSGESGTSEQEDTVIVSNANRDEAGLIKQIVPPQYLGAVIVCQGGDDPTVRLAIVEAVSDATGLGADRISVLKMK